MEEAVRVIHMKNSYIIIAVVVLLVAAAAIFVLTQQPTVPGTTMKLRRQLQLTSCTLA